MTRRRCGMPPLEAGWRRLSRSPELRVPLLTASAYDFAAAQPAVAVSVEPVERLRAVAPFVPFDAVVAVRVELIELVAARAARADGTAASDRRVVLLP